MPPKKNIITLLKDRETNIIPLTNNTLTNNTFARLGHLSRMNEVGEHRQRFQNTLNKIRRPPQIDERNPPGRKRIV
jgi:hypothetical protein